MKRDHGRPPQSHSAPIPVLHVITRLVRGGAQLVVRDLLRHTNRDRFRVTVAAGLETGPEGSLWDEVEALGVTAHRLEHLRRDIRPLTDLRALGELRQLIRREQPAIVHAHTSKAGLIGCLAARREKVPGIVFAPHGHIVASGARIPGVPSRGVRRWVIERLARYNSNLAHVVVAPNEAEREDGIAHEMWSDGRAITIPNGIDTERFRPADRDDARSQAGWPTDRPLIGCIARLTTEKGVDIAVRAIAQLPKAILVVVGDGPERTALEAHANELGVGDRIIFHGMTDDVAPLYPAFDVVVVPSRTEAHGLVAAEALACAIPVVTSGVGGLRSIVITGETGLHFSSDDSASLAVATQQLLDDPDLARRLGTAGHEHVTRVFSLRAMVEQTEQLYTTLLTEHATSTSNEPEAPRGLPAPN